MNKTIFSLSLGVASFLALAFTTNKALQPYTCVEPLPPSDTTVMNLSLENNQAKDDKIKAKGYTFKLADVKLAEGPIPRVQNAQDALRMSFGEGIEDYSDNLDKLVNVDYHPFVKMLEIAYMEHRPVSISPDMIWLMITQGFAQHVDINAEKLRDKFVKHEGKHKITVVRWEFRKGSSKNDWEGVFPEFADSIKAHTGEKLYNSVVNDFSTSTNASRAAFEIGLMDAMSSYFEYMVMTPLCGIPEVTIEGSTEDWKEILEDTKALGKYDLKWWTDELEPILEEFIKASEGDVDKKFWNSIFAQQTEELDVVCTTVNIDRIDGWANKFFPYTRHDQKNPAIDKKKFAMDKENYPDGISVVDFKWDYKPHATVYDMKMIGGFMGLAQDKETLTLQPQIGWAIQDVTGQKTDN